jgi:hypothetical protein
VTVLTEKSFEEYEQICEPRYFDETDLGELTPHVKEYRRRWPKDLVIIIAEVAGKLPDYLRVQLTELTDRRFPRHIINSVVNERIHQPYVPGEGEQRRVGAQIPRRYPCLP